MTMGAVSRRHFPGQTPNDSSRHSADKQHRQPHTSSSTTLRPPRRLSSPPGGRRAASSSRHRKRGRHRSPPWTPWSMTSASHLPSQRISWWAALLTCFFLTSLAATSVKADPQNRVSVLAKIYNNLTSGLS